MKTFEKTFPNGMHAELIIDPDGEPVSQCSIVKGECSGSLEALLDKGVLSDDNYETFIVVAQKNIDSIEKWALELGY